MSCGTVFQGFDFSCLDTISRKYKQKMVVINKDDIDVQPVSIAGDAVTACEHRVALQLKTGTTGHALTLPATGGSIFGSYDKAVNDLGVVEYTHKVNYAAIGVSEEIKCFLRGLDKGNYVVALMPEGTDIVEVYGYTNGLSNADYTFSITENNGGAVLVLQSQETAPESHIPFVHFSADPTADFDTNFAN